MTARRRSAPLIVAALLVATGVPAASGAGTDYSYLKNGTYKGTAVVPPGSTYVTPVFAGGRYPVGFRLTSPSRKGIRFIRGLTLGPVPALCNKPSGVVGKADEYAVRTLPRLSSFPAVTTNGFIIRSFVLRGTHWKPVPGRLGGGPDVQRAAPARGSRIRLQPQPDAVQPEPRQLAVGHGHLDHG